MKKIILLILSIIVLFTCSQPSMNNSIDKKTSNNITDKKTPILTKFTTSNSIIYDATFSFELEGHDDIGITGWLITTSYSKPSLSDSNWKSNKPSTFTLSGVGDYTVYAWAKDGVGNISNCLCINITFKSNDNVPPVITKFLGATGTLNTATFPIELDGTDNVGITNWLLTKSATPPSKDDPNWNNIKPQNYTLPGAGQYTIYAWAKDMAGNINTTVASISVNFVSSDNEAPVITNFTASNIAIQNLVNILELAGTDNTGITKWLITESNTIPAIDDPNWKSEKPVSYTIKNHGQVTLYAWAKDEAGNISNYKFFTVGKIADWTILIHLAIDNDLDYKYEKEKGIISTILTNLESQKALDSNDSVNVLILMDCYNCDTHFQDGYYKLTGENFNSDLSVSINEINSGNPADSYSFIDWALTNYPALHYFYSIVGEGSGFDDNNIDGTITQQSLSSSKLSLNKTISKSIAIDNSSNDSLSHNEIGKICDYLRQKINKKIDLFFADSWLMGGIELGYEIKDSVNYLISSEEIFPIDSWSPNFISSIISNPDISAVDIGKNICDSAYQFFSAKQSNFTLSLVDLSKMNNLYSSINSFSSESINFINNDSNKAKYFNNAADTSFIMCSTFNIKYYYVDLGSFFNNVINSSNIPLNIRNLATQVNSGLSNSVIYQKNYGYSLSTGLSIFHNIWNSAFQYPPTTYRSILTFGQNQWTDYITVMDSLTQVVEGDQYEPDDDFSSSNVMRPDASKQNHTFHKVDDIDCIKLDLTSATPGVTYKLETYYLSINTHTQMYLYDSSGNLLANDDHSGENGVYSKIIWTCQNPDMYRVRIKQFGNVSNSDYSFDFVTVP